VSDASIKPHVIRHMVASVDGHTLSSRWRARGGLATPMPMQETSAREAVGPRRVVSVAA